MHKWESLFETALHLYGLQCGYIFGTPENDPFGIWTDLFSRSGSMEIPKYTKYSEIPILCSGRKSLAPIIKKSFSADACYGGIPMQTKTKRLTESAMLLAVAVVLELVSKMLIPEMPFGGQVTFVSMLPVVLISYRHGVRWGLVAGLGYALIEMVIGAKTVAAAFQPGYFGDGALIFKALTMCLLDYLAAFTALGLGGAFRNRIGNPGMGLCCGSILALSARYACHVASGYILFSGWAEWFFTQEGFPAWGTALVERLSPGMLGFVYSLVYNGMYMVPELILTAGAALLIARGRGIVTKVS